MHRIIFLDIDGVLNSEAWSLYCHKVPKAVKDIHIPEWQDPRPIMQLIDFLDEHPEIKLVISSTWRCRTVEETKEYFKEFEFIKKLNPYIIGVTPKLYDTIRGHEIQAYLNEHPEVEKYVILDDDSDMLAEQMKYYIWVNNYYGLSKKHLNYILDLWRDKKDL